MRVCEFVQSFWNYFVCCDAAAVATLYRCCCFVLKTRRRSFVENKQLLQFIIIIVAVIFLHLEQSVTLQESRRGCCQIVLTSMCACVNVVSKMHLYCVFVKFLF